MYIIKANGQKEEFSIEKARRSCLRAGAPLELANEIAQKISRQARQGMSTKELGRLIFRYLSKSQPSTASRYSLREALLRLGPKGFTFEKLVAKIFEEEGYRVQTNQILQGKCVSHEIDVLLEKDKKVFTVECKFHHAAGFYTEIKDILYTWARFLDLKEGNQPFDLENIWLVSNTKFSEQTKQFALCRGINLLGWGYPEKRSLQNIIEEKCLYPITVLKTLEKKFEDRLISEGIITCQELTKIEPRSFQGKTGLDARKISILQKEALFIFKNSNIIQA